MKVNEFTDGSFKLLCTHPALPAVSKMFPQPFHAASRQLIVQLVVVRNTRYAMYAVIIEKQNDRIAGESHSCALVTWVVVAQ
jgi:hypothetical protein